jgi:hypothetical protein
MEFDRDFGSAVLPGEGGLVNEQEWENSTHPDAMNRLLLAWRTSGIPQETLKLIKGPALERKFRLFGCACVRRIWHLIGDERPRLALEVAERYADGLADRSKLRKAYLIAKRFVVREEREGRSILAAQAACRTAYCTSRGSEFEAYASVADFEARIAAGAAAKAQSSGPDKYELYRQAEAAEGTIQVQLLRDILGNPFRAAPTFDSKFRTTGVLKFAQELYDSRSFERLPTLASMLAGIGCKDLEILSHLRQHGPHVRGCWALDIVLDRS